MARPRTGSVEMRGGVYYARVEVGGVRRRVRLRAVDPAAARAEAAALAAVPEALADIPKPAPEAVTVATWAKLWVDERKARGLRSWKTDDGRLRRWVLPVAGDVPLRSLRQEHVDAIAARVRKLAALTQRNVLSALRSLLRDAARAGHPVRPVASERGFALGAGGIALPAPGRAEKALQYLWVADARALLASPEVPAERRRWYALLLYTGLRVGEAVALRVGDADLRHGVLYVARAYDRHNDRVAGTKTGRPREVPLEPALVPLVRLLCEGEGGGGRPAGAPLLTLPYGARRSRRLQADLHAAGVRTRPADGYTKALRVHDLRAAYITWSLARGDALVAVRDRVGHASFTMTERYVRSGVADRDRDWFPPLPPDLVGA